ncbi:hypothetical protein [Candidatus Amarolinea dominans]|uniref:hypothetical protein n=1 Tax=Candidatus Amarolinea dominans TaxID=3140696 RepID=UPI001D754399|nr:hypothetical protein [Anaerolineae bacterium]
MTTPTNGQVLGGTIVQVSGTASDRHTVTVTVNGETAPLVAGQFAIALTMAGGNQVVTVVATDAVGATTSETRLVALDVEWPAVAVVLPRDRQAVYSAMPEVDIHYSDYFGAVNTGTLNVQLQAAGGGTFSITNQLTVTAARAYGTLATPLQQDINYTMTVTLQDTFANQTIQQTTFYIPPDPGSIVPPAEPPVTGWVSGVVYDSTTCDEYLTTCEGLAGALVTLARVEVQALAAARAARKRLIAERLATMGENYTLPPLGDIPKVTDPVSGTIVTGQMAFCFPGGRTGHYWLREKGRFTYIGQREAAIARERSAATNCDLPDAHDPAATPVTLTAVATQAATTRCRSLCRPARFHPAARCRSRPREFDQVEYLPSGDLPEGTWGDLCLQPGQRLGPPVPAADHRAPTQQQELCARI